MIGVTMHARGTLGLNAANPIISLARSIRVNSLISEDWVNWRGSTKAPIALSILSDPINDRGKHDHHRFSVTPSFTAEIGDRLSQQIEPSDYPRSKMPLRNTRYLPNQHLRRTSI
jgi:hypothetical protein